jgi:hypothetical protein
VVRHYRGLSLLGFRLCRFAPNLSTIAGYNFSLVTNDEPFREGGIARTPRFMGDDGYKIKICTVYRVVYRTRQGAQDTFPWIWELCTLYFVFIDRRVSKVVVQYVAVFFWLGGERN